MQLRIADRMGLMETSVIRDTMKLAEKPNIISFAGGMPAPEIFPVEQLKMATMKVYENNGREALQYSSSEGYLPLREKIAGRHRNAGISCTAEDIMILSGSQQGIDFTGKVFLNKGDLVVCENPTYTSALIAFRSYQCEFLPIETDDDGMLMEDLEEKLKSNPKAKMIYVIPDFQNPTGRTWSLERRKKLVEIATKYSIPIIEDNPYGELRYEGEAIPPVKSFDTEGIVAFLGSFSKVLSPGFRIGWVLASPHILSQYKKLKQAGDLHSSTIIQRTINTFLDDNDIDEHISKLRDVYRRRRDVMIETIRMEFPEDISYTVPHGGLFAWITLPEGMDTQLLVPKVIEKNVAFIPGATFFANGEVKNALRLNFSNTDEERIKIGIKFLGEAIIDELNQINTTRR